MSLHQVIFKGKQGAYQVNSLQNAVDKIKEYLLLNSPVIGEIRHYNLQRILFMSYVLIPLHIFHIIIFWLALVGNINADDTVAYQWRTGIITAHSIMLFFVLSAAFTAWRICRVRLEASLLSSILPAFMSFAYLLFGASLAVIDQLVTTNVSPYLIANLAVALAIIMHPYISIVIYPFVLTCFFIALPLTQHNSELLISNFVNAVSSAVFGLGLAILIWRSTALGIDQHSMIEKQKEELERKNLLLKHLATTDMMTGLYNRTRFTEIVETEIERIKRTGEDSCLIILDLDHFKVVNDLYGHPNGDTVLKLIAGVIKGQLRSTDILCRFGGEEFAALLPDTSIDGACRVAEKIRHAIEGCTFTGKLEKVKITASLGITLLGNRGSKSFETAYQQADKALYTAKDNGRNRIELFA
jgi:diguanylate cyclase